MLGQANIAMLSFPADSTQYFLPLDCLSFSVLKRSIQNGRGARTKLTPAEGVLDAVDALQKATTIKTTQAAWRLAGIDFALDHGKLVAKVVAESFQSIIKKLKADNTITSSPRPAPKRASTKKPFGLLNEEYLKKK
ncbi:MAG: hypothetical protein EZS28_006528 [Streblomastix strix]|uniref:Uncharacterized protein n=1 Tax=Streblomastix strix TaxID=222440 RepID=A0A5J4WSN3_9EUKA|nr:MAG: hypothetical protein EZS28_006528 [Streblomastix strix]